MITEKESQENIINIRQAWLKAINRVAEALAYRYKSDVQDQCSEQAGIQTVIESVVALSSLLVDYGEATVRSDVNDWYNKHIKDDKAKSEFERMKVYQMWFEYMVQTLHKYGLLFETMPKGYSNTTMTSI